MSATGEHHDTAISRQVRDLEDLLEQRGLVAGADLDGIIDRFLERAQPINGARVVARAWTDPDYADRLAEDGTAAVQELGYAAAGAMPVRLRAVFNTAEEHNVVVCTLCSCYPIGLLGPSPSWYKSEAYRSRVVREPRAVLAEFGLELRDDVRVRVWDASAETRYLVVPLRPEGADALDEEQLAALVTRNGLIGTAAV